MGVELGLNCPDRSWCGTLSPGTTQRGDTGRPNSRDELREERLREGGERDSFEEKPVK
jgi:hypothetical protein